ncbi:MAG: dihydrodipicolinate synthase family protein, partial [Clostridia bacterium]|nr:dihydrodipicolinate synthase family protein [Clostridia bacterium]
MYRVYTALVTPFVDYKIDFESLHKLIDKANNSKCKGVVALGSTGESHLLDDKQKLAVLKFVAKHSTKTVIAGVSSPSTNTCASLAKKYSQAGANALLMTPPYFVCCNGKGLLKHFENVQKATKLPIILY